MEIKDVRIDTHRPGPSYTNYIPICRLTHVPTGLQVECQDRFDHKRAALKELESLVHYHLGESNDHFDR